MQNFSGPLSPLDPEPDWDAIARFVAGESGPDESRMVQAWLDAHPGDARLVVMVERREAGAASRAAVSVDVDAALVRVRRLMEASDGSPLTAAPLLRVEHGGAPRLSPADRRTGVGRIAAPVAARSRIRGWQVAALVSAAALVLIVARDRNGAPGAAAEQVFATNVGARDSVLLSDGTRVVLAPGSKLTVSAGYGGTSRHVTLAGAAFFEVRHDAARPFTVSANGAEIQDIGTAFSVKTDAVGNVSVAVTDGVVAVHGAGTDAKASVELRAGDRGVVTGEQVAVSRGSVRDEDVAWTRGHLAYHDAPMSEVQADVRRWYGIDLRFGNPELAARTLSTSFGANSAADVIKVIALALGVDAVQHGDTVMLRMTGRSTTP